MRIDFPAICHAAGIPLRAYNGWQARGSGEPGYAPKAWLVHHDASAAGPSPNVGAYLQRMLDSDRPSAPLWLDYAGTMHVIGWGPAYHAGLGSGCGPISRNDGNDDSVGIETDHTTGEAWPPEQLDALIRFLRAGCHQLGWDPLTTVWGHKEYAPGRKVDPANLDMDWLRLMVAQITVPNPPPPPPPPPPAPPAPAFPLPWSHFFGPKAGPTESHSGYYNNDDDKFRPWQAQMARRGWTITADGYYGEQTRGVAVAFQKEKIGHTDGTRTWGGVTKEYGLVGPQTWRLAWTAAIS